MILFPRLNTTHQADNIIHGGRIHGIQAARMMLPMHHMPLAAAEQIHIRKLSTS